MIQSELTIACTEDIFESKGARYMVGTTSALTMRIYRDTFGPMMTQPDASFEIRDASHIRVYRILVRFLALAAVLDPWRFLPLLQLSAAHRSSFRKRIVYW